jgi:hypothetical protein
MELFLPKLQSTNFRKWQLWKMNFSTAAQVNGWTEAEKKFELVLSLTGDPAWKMATISNEHPTATVVNIMKMYENAMATPMSEPLRLSQQHIRHLLLCSPFDPTDFKIVGRNRGQDFQDGFGRLLKGPNPASVQPASLQAKVNDSVESMALFAMKISNPEGLPILQTDDIEHYMEWKTNAEALSSHLGWSPCKLASEVILSMTGIAQKITKDLCPKLLQESNAYLFGNLDMRFGHGDGDFPPIGQSPLMAIIYHVSPATWKMWQLRTRYFLSRTCWPISRQKMEIMLAIQGPARGILLQDHDWMSPSQQRVAELHPIFWTVMCPEIGPLYLTPPSRIQHCGLLSRSVERYQKHSSIQEFFSGLADAFGMIIEDSLQPGLVQRTQFPLLIQKQRNYTELYSRLETSQGYTSHHEHWWDDRRAPKQKLQLQPCMEEDTPLCGSVLYGTTESIVEKFEKNYIARTIGRVHEMRVMNETKYALEPPEGQETGDENLNGHCPTEMEKALEGMSNTYCQQEACKVLGDLLELATMKANNKIEY